MCPEFDYHRKRNSRHAENTLSPFRSIGAVSGTLFFVVATTYVIPRTLIYRSDRLFQIPGNCFCERLRCLAGALFHPGGEAWLWYFAVPVSRAATAKPASTQLS